MSRNNQIREPLVLVVDDERIIADTLATILNRAGFRATAAYDGQDAIKQAPRLRPSLLLTDVCMPGLNGVEAALKIQQLVPTCKVVLRRDRQS